MTSKEVVAQSKLKVIDSRRALNVCWEEALDEEGNFDWIFGDPSLTSFAVRIKVKYDEDEKVLVEVIHPVAENTLLEAEDGLTKHEQEDLVNVAYETASLLDCDVPAFAHGIYDYLSGFGAHTSFVDPLWEAWTAETKNLSVAQNASKLAAQQQQAKSSSAHKPCSTTKPTQTKKVSNAVETKGDRRRKKERDAEQKRLELAAPHAERWRCIRQEVLRKRMAIAQKAKEAALQQEAQLQAQAALDEQIDEQAAKLLEGVTWSAADDPALVGYLKRVYLLQSPFVLWSGQALTCVPSFVPLLHWLQEINLSDNALENFPPEFLELPQLKRLFLHSNRLTRLPPLGNLGLLEILDLHNNAIVLLPGDLGLLTKLQVLDMERNQLRSIPPELGDLTSLSHFNVAHNRIKIVPLELTQLSNLSFLDLKHNPIVNLPPHIYLQGTAAVLTFLRNQTTNATLIQPPSLIADFSSLLKEKSGFLADLVLRASDFAGKTNFPSHRVIICARCPYLANALYTRQATGKTLPTDPESGLPALDLDLDHEALTIVVQYLYTDSYTKPELPLLSIEVRMTEEEIMETVKQNQLLSAQFSASLERASGTAMACQLSHLQYLVDRNLRHSEIVESTFIRDLKAVYEMMVSPMPDMASLGISVPSNGLLDADSAVEIISSASKVIQTDSRQFCDVSFSFPAYPSVAPIDAHKVVLCARSTFFTSLLTGGLVESSQRIVEIKEMDPNVFSSVVEFCYTDDVYELSGDTIMELLTAARLYGLKRLQGIIESVVGYSLDCANVTGIFTISALHSLRQLGRACKFFILSNWESVVQSPGWHEIPQIAREKFEATARDWGIIPTCQINSTM